MYIYPAVQIKINKGNSHLILDDIDLLDRTKLLEVFVQLRVRVLLANARDVKSAVYLFYFLELNVSM